MAVMLSEAKHLVQFHSPIIHRSEILRFAQNDIVTLLVAEQTFLVAPTCIPFLPGLPKLLLWLKLMFH